MFCSAFYTKGPIYYVEQIIIEAYSVKLEQFEDSHLKLKSVCVCVRVRACVRVYAYVRACVGHMCVRANMRSFVVVGVRVQARVFEIFFL